MRKGSDLLGKVIITYDTGEKIARVQDLIFDETSNRLLGLLVSEGGLLRQARVVPFSKLQAIGPSAVIVPSASAVTKARSVPEIRAILKRNNILKGTRILTVNGRDLGTIIDLYFDDQSGAIEGYEVSGGLFADAYSGRSFVPASHALKIGEDVAFVPVETAELMQEQVGGFRKAVQTASDSLQTTTAAAVSRVQQATNALQTTTAEAFQKLQEASVGEAAKSASTQMATERLQETTETAGQQAIASLTNAIVDPAKQKEFVIGKTAVQDVFAPDGTLLVMQGQPVTVFIAEEAERLGVLEKLYRATGGQLGDAIQRQWQETASKTLANLQEIASLTNEKMQQAARQASLKLTNAIVDPDEQMALVVDRPVDRDVCNPDGTLLIAKGQTVTPEIASAARQQGILDQLFRATGGSLVAELSRYANNALASRLLSQTEGRRVHRTVQTSDGFIVAAAGQIVTPQVIERARTYQQEQALLSAVGLTPAEATRVNVNQRLLKTTDQLVDEMTQFRENASVLVEVLKHRWEQLRQQAIRMWEERRIKHALGRPVNRIILDREDNVILKPGDIITHQAIEQARQADVIDILFSSVHTGNAIRHAPRTEFPTASGLPPAKEEVVVKVG